MAARFEDLNSKIEETVRHLDDLGKASERQSRTSRDLEESQKRQRDDAQSALGTVLGGAGAIGGATVRAGGVAAASAFGSTGDLATAGSAAFGSLAFRAIDSARQFSVDLPGLGPINVGNLAVEGSGLGATQRSLLGAQSQAEASLLGLARYGINVSDEALDNVLQESFEQNQRVEGARQRIAGRLGALAAERGVDGGNEIFGELKDVVVQILEELRKGIAGGGS